MWIRMDPHSFALLDPDPTPPPGGKNQSEYTKFLAVLPFCLYRLSSVCVTY